MKQVTHRSLRLLLAMTVAILNSAAPLSAEPTRSVPFPFSPVSVEKTGAKTTVSVWGRELVFERGPLPRQIRSQGIGLFAEPPVFRASERNSSSPVEWGPVEVVNRSDTSVTLRSGGATPKLNFVAVTTIEYDGMIRTLVRVSAPSAVEVTRFSYELSLPETVATHFTQHVAYDYRTLRVDLRKLVESAGRVRDGDTSYSFAPSFSLSNDRVGIEWWAESGSGLAPKPIRVTSAGSTVRWAFEPIARRIPLEPGTWWEHEFALFPLPLRPLANSWRQVRFTGPAEAKRIGTRAGTRHVWIAFPLQFSARWHGLPASLRDEKQRRLRTDLSGSGVGYIPYGKLAAAPSLHPVAMARAADWAASSERWTGPPAEEAEHMRKHGWQIGQAYGYAPCLGDDGYLDWILKQNLEAFDAERPAGLYFDFGSILAPCVRGANGSSPSMPKWNYFSVRRFFRSLYEQVKLRDPDALITVHSNGQPKALAGFVDFVFVGEALNVHFRGGRSFAEMRSRPEIYHPDYYSLPPGFLDALIFPQSGGITALLPEIHHARDPRDPERLKPFTRSLLSLALSNDYPLWWVNADFETRVSVAKALDRFHGLAGARVVHWRDRAPDPVSCQLRVTSYIARSETMLVVSNPDRAPCVGALRVAEDRRTVASVRDLESMRPLEVAAGLVKMSVPPRDFRLLKVAFSGQHDASVATPHEALRRRP